MGIHVEICRFTNFALRGYRWAYSISGESNRKKKENQILYGNWDGEGFKVPRKHGTEHPFCLG